MQVPLQNSSLHSSQTLISFSLTPPLLALGGITTTYGSTPPLLASSFDSSFLVASLSLSSSTNLINVSFTDKCRRLENWFNTWRKCPHLFYLLAWLESTSSSWCPPRRVLLSWHVSWTGDMDQRTGMEVEEQWCSVPGSDQPSRSSSHFLHPEFQPHSSFHPLLQHSSVLIPVVLWFYWGNCSPSPCHPDLASGNKI